MTGIKYTDLKIVRDETGAVVTVKSASVDKKDNTKVAIETYEALTDGKAYTVTYTAADEAKTESSATFTATTGEVKDIALNTYSIPANTLTEIKYQTLDENGVIIAEAGIGSAAAKSMEISVENANGYQKDNELLLYKTGDTATLKVVYHTYKYNNTDGTEEGKVEKSFTITAVDQSSVIETYDYSVAYQRSDIDFKRDKLVQQTAIGDDADKTPKAFFSFRKADGSDITSSLDYTVSTGNENVLLASGSVADGAELTPVAVGSTYLVIKDSKGAVIKTLPINVVAKRTLSTMTVDKSNVTVSAQSGAQGQQKITVTVMDQYGDPYSSFTAKNPERKTTTDPNDLDVDVTSQLKNKVTVTVKADDAKDGTYAYTMDLEDSVTTTNVKKVSFSVTVVKELTNNNSYALVLRSGNAVSGDIVSKVDTTVTADDYGATTLYPTIVKKNNGSIIGNATNAEVVTISALKLTKNGATVNNDNNIYAPKVDSVNGTAQVKVSEGDGTSEANAIKKNLDPGTYTVSFVAYIDKDTDGKYDFKQNMSTSFVVEDSQKVFEADVKKTDIPASDATTLEGVFNNDTCVKFSYASEGLSRDRYPYDYVSAKQTRVNSSTINVEKVTMNVVVPGTGDKWVQLTAGVNRTFKFGELTASASNTDSTIKTFTKNYTTSTGVLSSTYKTPAKAAEVVDDAFDIMNKYWSLTEAEQTSLATSYNKAMSVAKEAAAVVLPTLTASSDTNYVVGILDILSDKEIIGAEVANYAKLVPGNTVIAAANTSSAAINAADDIITTVATTRAYVKADLAKAVDIVTSSGSIAAETSGCSINVAVASGSTITVTGTVISTACTAAAITKSAITPTWTPGASGTIKFILAAGTAGDFVAGDEFTVTYEVYATQNASNGGKTAALSESATTANVTYAFDGSTWTIKRS